MVFLLIFSTFKSTLKLKDFQLSCIFLRRSGANCPFPVLLLDLPSRASLQGDSLHFPSCNTSSQAQRRPPGSLCAASFYLYVLMIQDRLLRTSPAVAVVIHGGDAALAVLWHFNLKRRTAS